MIQVFLCVLFWSRKEECIVWSKWDDIEEWSTWQTLKEQYKSFYSFLNIRSIHGPTSIKKEDKLSRRHLCVVFLILGKSYLRNERDKSCDLSWVLGICVEDDLRFPNFRVWEADLKILSNVIWCLMKGEVISLVVGGTFCQVELDTWADSVDWLGLA